MSKAKKALSIVLAGATATSLLAVSIGASAAAAPMPNKTAAEYRANGFGIVGAMTGWANGADVAMSDEDGDGIFEATFTVPETLPVWVADETEAGGHNEDKAVSVDNPCQYKVRSVFAEDGDDAAWDHSWGMFDEENGSWNGQTNYSATAPGEVTVYLDTTVEEIAAWQLVTEKPEAPANPINPDDPEDPTDPTEPEEPTDPVEPEEPSEGDITLDKLAAEVLGEENVKNYVFFDNSKTQWDQVGAYWWDTDENTKATNAAGEEYSAGAWPGVKATKLSDDYDYWYIEMPVNAGGFIWDNYVGDAGDAANPDKSVPQCSKENPKRQTANLVAEAGKLYVPVATSGKMNFAKTGETLEEGAWVELSSVVIGQEVPVEPSEDPSSEEPSEKPSDNKPSDNNNNSNADAPKTGDAAPIALVAVFGVAALAVVVLAKKKVTVK